MTARFEVSGYSQDNEGSTRGVSSAAVGYLRIYMSALQGSSAGVRHTKHQKPIPILTYQFDRALRYVRADQGVIHGANRYLESEHAQQTIRRKVSLVGE